MIQLGEKILNTLVEKSIIYRLQIIEHTLCNVDHTYIEYMNDKYYITEWWAESKFGKKYRVDVYEYQLGNMYLLNKEQLKATYESLL